MLRRTCAGPILGYRCGMRARSWHEAGIYRVTERRFLPKQPSRRARSLNMGNRPQVAWSFLSHQGPVSKTPGSHYAGRDVPSCERCLAKPRVSQVSCAYNTIGPSPAGTSRAHPARDPLKMQSSPRSRIGTVRANMRGAVRSSIQPISAPKLAEHRRAIEPCRFARQPADRACRYGDFPR